MQPSSVIVPLRYDRKGEQMLAYGVDLANRLERPVRFGLGPYRFQDEAEQRMNELRENRCVGMLATAGADHTALGYEYDAYQACIDHPHILVADKSFRHNHVRHVLVPFDEKVVAPNWRGKVMVPFGTGESSLHAFTTALPLVKDLGLPVLFYHTTWRSPRTQSEDPIDHVCDEAREVLDALRKECTAWFIPSSVVIEMTDSVVHGALLCALKQCCRLMVVARGKNTGKGSYVDQWLDHSTVPMLIIGRKL